MVFGPPGLVYACKVIKVDSLAFHTNGMRSLSSIMVTKK